MITYCFYLLSGEKLPVEWTEDQNKIASKHIIKFICIKYIYICIYKTYIYVHIKSTNPSTSKRSSTAYNTTLNVRPVTHVVDGGN